MVVAAAVDAAAISGWSGPNVGREPAEPQLGCEEGVGIHVDSGLSHLAGW